jgi:hypothetical protein
VNSFLRTGAIATMFLIASGSIASANTVELTLTVPMTITLPANTQRSGVSPLPPFDVACVIGTGLGYATGAGAQGTIVGQGSTALSGSKTVQNQDGSFLASPKATVIITYDDGLNPGVNRSAGGGKNVSQYLCWVQWRTPNPSLAPFFVQGSTNL